MSSPQVIPMPLPDAAARERIVRDLDVNLLVEAGAGSGKTTKLVDRMTALIVTGAARVDAIAAVTFTRKAAAELRERFQGRLEQALTSEVDPPNEEVRARLRAALDGIDRAFLGTIHAFCSKLLRERPLQVGLDPGFQELPPDQILDHRREFWGAYLERIARDADPVLEDLSEAGLRAYRLYDLFERLVENPDVHFPAEEVEPPARAEVTPVRRELEGLVLRSLELMPEREPIKNWDSLQKRLRTAAFLLDVTGWTRPADFFDALALLCKPGPNGHSATYKRWKDPDLAKALKLDADAFGVGDTPAQRLLDRWLAHRYALAMRLASAAAGAYAEHRIRTGRLDFQDLLVLAARLLRENPGARRDLGRRYRHLLVDEFQDTDPLQAEVMLLLASEPSDEGEEERDWRVAQPRPGALFVVGDPKQSIYRFRRADIQLYEFVKSRFEAFGDVLRLTTNFRSRPAIGDIVNDVFAGEGFFPPEATSRQARFEPLDTRGSHDQPVREGIFWYPIDPARSAQQAVAEDDAARVANWIRERIDAGERPPGDFLLLTRLTRSLSVYARALEARSVPVQVTGAGVAMEEELAELVLLLECMIDPTNSVGVAAALVGLFFGLDFEDLVRHRLAGGRLDALRPGREGDATVLEALGVLHGWWRRSTREPADVFLGRLVPELGLLPHAAAGELGAVRAGALVYALDAVRAAALAGDASLPGALRSLSAALAVREAEAPLEPGRPDVVRLMNLHQAKGLEGKVVVLLDPARSSVPDPFSHVERRADGSAVGHACVRESRGFGYTVLARPPGWPRMESEAKAFEEAESVRLLYVAVTRAAEELVVARWEEGKGVSSWIPLDPWLLEHAERLDLHRSDPPRREVLRLAPEEARERVTAAAEAIAEAAVPSFHHVSVTQVAKAATEKDLPGREGSGADPPAEPYRGYSWGSAVHGALAAAALDPSEERLRSAARVLLVEHGRPLDDHGEPIELDELLSVVRSVRDSELWRRAHAAKRVLSEVPFAAPGATRPPLPRRSEAAEDEPGQEVDPGEHRQLDLFGAERSEAKEEELVPEDDDSGPDPLPAVLEGVIDLAFREEDGWVIADYKTDVGTDPEFPARRSAYRRQVDLYAEAWTRLTGETVKERVLFFTARGELESW